jgi:hypothetical protein
VVTAAREYSGSAPQPPRRPEWYTPGWLDAVDEWIDDALAAAGRRRTGPSVVTRMWSLSAIVRVATDTGTVVFKSTGGGFEAEPTVTTLLAEHYGELVPTVLHVGNVAYDGDRVRVFDWTDPAVGHPSLDVVLLARSADEGTGDHADEPPLDRDVTDAYTARWRAHLPGADVERAMELAVPVNELYQALSYEGISRHQEDAARWELGGVVERFLRRLPHIVDGVR